MKERRRGRLTQRWRCVVPALGIVLVDVELCRLEKITDNDYLNGFKYHREDRRVNCFFLFRQR